MSIPDYNPRATVPQTFANTPSRIPGSVPKEECKELKELIRPHIDSYNFMLDKGLSLAVKDIPPMEVVFVFLPLLIGDNR